MVNSDIKRRHSAIPKIEAVNRIVSIPIVGNSLKSVESVYQRVKKSNGLTNWYFDTAEGFLKASVDTFAPVLSLVEGPIHKIDEVVCKSLEVVEQRVPIYLPPELMYWNTKEYMSDRIVQPMLKRAVSMKNLTSNIVLENKVTDYTATRIDGAMNVFEKYVDRYLPDSQAAKGQDVVDLVAAQEDDDQSRCVQAIHHGQRLSRKLKRRLTARTIEEVQALKKQSAEAVHILIYAAELIIKDPREAVKKAGELWQHLSKDEPGNQQRPKTLEQLIVLVTRESFRKLVHCVNYTSAKVAKIPRDIKTSFDGVIHHFYFMTSSVLSLTHLEVAKEKATKEAGTIIGKFNNTYDEIQSVTVNVLVSIVMFFLILILHMVVEQLKAGGGHFFAKEQIAIFLSGRLEAEKIPSNPRRRFYNRGNNQVSNINGVY